MGGSNTPLGAKRLGNYRCFGTENATGVPNGSVITDVSALTRRWGTKRLSNYRCFGILLSVGLGYTPLGCQSGLSNTPLGSKKRVFSRIFRIFKYFRVLA